MFGIIGKILALARTRLSLSAFSMWVIHGGWIATGALTGTIVTIKMVELFLVQGVFVDPFLPYEAILPGNDINMLTPYHCTVSVTRINGQLDASRFSCAIFPQDGFFDTIHVESRNNQITELTFYANKVTVGDLMLHWKPNARPHIAPAVIDWNTSNYEIEVTGHETHYNRLVRIITIHMLLPKMH